MKLLLCGLIALSLHGQKIVCGGPQDQYFTGGATWPSPVVRYGNFSYLVPAPDGEYRIHLSFVEPSGLGAGARKFDVLVNGVAVLANYDIALAKTPTDEVVPAQAAGGAIQIQFVTKVRNAVVSSIELVKYRKYAAVTVFDGPNACDPGTSFYGPHYGGHICAVPAAMTPNDFNFGASVTPLTRADETMIHGYSLPSPVSATNRYIGVNDVNGNHFALDRVSGVRHQIPGSYLTVIWDAVNDDLLYYPQGKLWFKYSVSGAISTMVADYSATFTGGIQTGGSTHTSSDNWVAFWSNEDHRVCALDLNAAKTYCADMSAPETRSDKLPWQFVDYSVVTDIDSGSGKRYVLLMSAPSLGAWSVDRTAGVLRFEFRGGENPASQGFLNPTANGDGRCDPGESCLNAPHGDAASFGGVQYFVTTVETSSTPCQRDMVALPIAQGELMVPQRVTIFPMAFCSSAYDWPDFHVGCSRVGACVISTESNGLAPMGNQIMLMRDLDHVVKLGFHRSVLMGSDTYWYQPRAGISPDGRYIVFDSNLGQPDQGNGFAHEQVYLMRTDR